MAPKGTPPMEIPADLRSQFTALGVRAEEIVEKFVRGSGPGGQKINKTSSTVWLRHEPSGLEVRCQAERSQSANRARAWADLADKLAARAAAAALATTQAREKARRQTRQKSRGQKRRMVAAKQVRARHKAGRRPVTDDG